MTLDKAFVQYISEQCWLECTAPECASKHLQPGNMDGILKYHYKIYSILLNIAFLAKHDDHQNQIITLQQLQDSILCVLQQHTVEPNSATVNVYTH